MSDKIFVGLDVSKDWIDVAIHAGGPPRRIANTGRAIEAWIAELDCPRIGLIAFEPTGGYEQVLRRCLCQAELPFAGVHPNQVVGFRCSRGVKAKTDRIDAGLWRHLPRWNGADADWRGWSRPMRCSAKWRCVVVSSPKRCTPSAVVRHWRRWQP